MQNRNKSSANDAPTVHTAKTPSALLLLERIPESQRLIASTCDDDLAVWTHGQVEDTVGMACQRDDLLHAWVFPDDDLVLTVAMCGDNFVAVFRPC